MKRALIALLVVVAIGAGAGAYYIRRTGNGIQVNTLPVTRGDLIDTVGATGTLQAVISVTVGSQVSGNISWLGADFNSIVHKGDVVAKIEPSIFQAQVDQAKASISQSTAQLGKDEATLAYAKLTYQRDQDLNKDGFVSQDALDSARAAAAAAQGQVELDKANIEQAEAQRNQYQVNLDHTVIYSPIDGIVIQRSVDVGQTVAASMQSPTIFIIAADLTKLQVNANIDEADVGRIRPGQVVTFKVDAYPTDEFQGTVAQVRLQPIVVQNVTTYNTMVNVPNADFRLKPGMTANLKVQIAHRSDVLRVPNSALRFRPNTDMFAALNQEIPPELQGGRGRRGGQGAGQAPPGPTAATESAPGSPGSSPAEAANAPPAGRGERPNGQAAGDRPTRPDDGNGRARLAERLKNMSPEERQQTLARMAARGMDVSGLEAPPVPLAVKVMSGGQGGSPQTVDALFGPLPKVESTGRAWLFIDNQLKPVRLRLGITDGTNSELLSGELQPGMELVTGILLNGTRSAAGGAGVGNPLIPQRGGGPPGRGR